MNENTNTKRFHCVESCLSSTDYDREVFKKLRTNKSFYKEANCAGRTYKQQAFVSWTSDMVFQLSRDEDAVHSTSRAQNLPDVFIEQEKSVLTNFRDCLCKLASCGRLELCKLSLAVWLIKIL